MSLKPPLGSTTGVPSVLDVIDDTSEFVAAPTGNADIDTATLLAALDANVNVTLSSGTYLVYPDELVMDLNGHDLRGAGYGSNGTIIKAATTGDYVLKLGSSGTGTGGRRGHVGGIYLDGDGKADVGLRIYSGSYSLIERLYAINALEAGVYFDTEGTGNNNGCELLQVICSDNTGVGIGCAADQLDNNAVNFFGVRATFNGSHGILWKGLGFCMFGGHLESNTGYGFRAAEAADVNTVQDVHLYKPWVENNTAGGVLFTSGKSQRCVYERYAISGVQELDFANSDTATHQRETQATGKTRYKSGTDSRYGEYGYDRIESQGGTDTDRDFFIALKGKGGVKLGTSVSSNNPGYFKGAGTPEGNQPAAVGSIYFQTDGNVVTCVWKKAVGTTTTAGWVPLGAGERTQTIATDANFTLNPYASPEHTLHTGTLTAGRTVTLTNNANASAGMHFKITRTGGGAFNLDVGGLKNLATNQWCEVIYDGTNWKLAAFGAL